ncbi:MAG: CHASE2 domain-containing protein [Marinicaulis sp.]|nr:CHASE2 domain-containing protein [Marinicaulis sp.]
MEKGTSVAKQNSAKEILADSFASLVIVVVVAIASFFGAFDALDDYFTDKRFKYLQEPVASNAVIVAIDTKSLQALPNWPWPRAYHGALVDRLNKAGVSRIAFDIDFSAPGEAQSTAAFGDSIRRSDVPVVLAAFRQQLSVDLPDVIAEITPTDPLKEFATIASVNYPIEKDGVVRNANAKMDFSFGPVPSIAFAALGAAAGDEQYGIDFSIAPGSFAIHSYIDVLEGDIPAQTFSGKTVFVGATAIELGDEYVIPVSGVTSGIILNALAYETVRQGRKIRTLPAPYTLALGAVLAFFLNWRWARSNFIKQLIAQVAIVVIVAGVSIIVLDRFQLNVNVTSILAIQLLCGVYTLGHELEKRARIGFYARMTARDKSALVETLVSENHEGFIVTDDDGRIEMCNQRAAHFLNWECTPIGENMATKAPKLINLVADLDETGIIGRFEFDTSKGSDRRSVLDVTVSRTTLPIYGHRLERRTAERVFIVYALHDITSQKRAEEQERAAKEAYASTSAAKSQLISTMSHELRTPLNAIIGFSDILTNESLGPLGPPEYSDYVKQIHNGGRKLNFILNDLLHSAQLQGDELDLQIDAIDAQDLLDQAVKEAGKRPYWGDADVSVNTDPGLATLRIDFKYLQFALSHLIDNAAKFAGPKAQINITAQNYRGAGIIKINDNGPGCAEKDLPRLTEMFFQADGSYSRNYEGCGLGLFIADRIIRRHGGRLRLNSQPDQGFEAVVVLRNATAKARHEAA